MTMSDDSSNAAPSSGSAPPSDPAEELARHRARIDELDHAIVELLNERAKAAIAIGEVKKNTAWRSGRRDGKRKSSTGFSPAIADRFMRKRCGRSSAS